MLLFISIRQVLLILGIILLMRFIGKIMTARRNVNEQTNYNNQENLKKKAKADYGKTSIGKVNKNKFKESDYTDFEEVE